MRVLLNAESNFARSIVARSIDDKSIVAEPIVTGSSLRLPSLREASFLDHMLRIQFLRG